MYSADDINELLKQYISSPAGKKHLKEKGVQVFAHNKKSAMRIAQMLKDDINNTFLSKITDDDPDALDYFSPKWVSVTPININNQWTIKITYSKHALYRPSLWARKSKKYSKEGFTGSGVKDVFALFTNGYSTSKRVFGYWSHFSQGQGYMGDSSWTASKTHRQPDSFIAQIVKDYESRYPEIKINFPRSWGGNGKD